MVSVAVTRAGPRFFTGLQNWTLENLFILTNYKHIQLIQDCCLRFLSVIVERWPSSILKHPVVIPSLNHIFPSLDIILDVK